MANLLFIALLAVSMFSALGGVTSVKAQITSTPNPIDPPLYPQLTWNNIGIEDQTIYVNDAVHTISGNVYKANEELDGKLPPDLIVYYSIDNLSQLGWQATAGGISPSAIAGSYYHSTGRYLVVEFSKCGVESSATCVKVWESLETIAVPSPAEPNIVTNTISSYANPLDVPKFAQGTPEVWAGDILGNLRDGAACNYSTLANYGCWVTSYAMMYKYYGSTSETPRTLNNKLRNANLYGENGACDNFMPVSPLPFPPSGVSYNSAVYNNCTSVNCIDTNNVPLILEFRVGENGAVDAPRAIEPLQTRSSQNYGWFCAFLLLKTMSYRFRCAGQ